MMATFRSDTHRHGTHTHRNTHKHTQAGMKTHAETYTTAGERIEVATASGHACVLSLVCRHYAAGQQVAIAYAIPHRTPRTVTAATVQGAIAKLSGDPADARLCAGAAAAALAALQLPRNIDGDTGGHSIDGDSIDADTEVPHE